MVNIYFLEGILIMFSPGGVVVEKNTFKYSIFKLTLNFMGFSYNN